MTFQTLSAILSVSIITISVPILILIFWCCRKKAKVMPALTGAIVFLIFTQILEMIPHIFFLFTDNPVSRVITSNPFLYALYVGFVAGVFEETGRFVGFRFLQKKFPGKETSITYGIGHGGFEAMSLAGFRYIQYFAIAMMIHKGTIDEMLAGYSGTELASLEQIVTLISSLSVEICVITIAERIYAFVFHVALSVLVYHAVNVSGKKHLFLAAILLHTGMDFFAGLYQMDVLPLVATEAIGIIFTGLTVLFAYRIYTAKENTI